MKTWGVTVSLAVIAPLLLVPAMAWACTKADVVALDQPFWYNRMGAYNPAGMIFALRRDVVDQRTGVTCDNVECEAGAVELRPNKRPRPLVLRVQAGECLEIHFQNLLANTPKDMEQPATRAASVHVMGMSLMDSILSDGSNVGANDSSLVGPGGSAVYRLKAGKEGTYLMYSAAATSGGEGNGGSLAAGLFGAVNVEPVGSRWYRSQVTAADLEAATREVCTPVIADVGGTAEVCEKQYTEGGQPMLDYEAVDEDGVPILRMTDADGWIVHGDLNAIITHPAGTYVPNVANPGRESAESFREFTVIFHDEITALQAFPIFEDADFKHTLHSVRDSFAINYGTGGIGAEIVANRLGLGPMKDCVDCKYEEFFLTSWAVGDPAMVVDVPANASNPAEGIVATQAFYPDDPSNVHHSYLNDRVKFRNLHAGPKEHHIFHLHAHQWLHTPDSDNSAYLDSQHIGPGSGFTYEVAYGGSGNRNKTAGDSIFHCHFYPHFAQGMWELWRVHDVFEDGNAGRMLPDGEIVAGTPIPAVVPMPKLAMAPMPTDAFPGYPFYIPGTPGHRPPTPPMDLVEDGGLPRHVITGGTAHSVETPLDFSKEVLTANALQLPEGGTAQEQAAMAFHAANHGSFTPEGDPAVFETNARPPQPGAPFADPCRPQDGYNGTNRYYHAAGIQLDVVLNKAGWHFPQQRVLALWGDVEALYAQEKAPEPLFMRTNSGDCVTLHHTNLIPSVYEQDDFQVRTPTDVLGQHIHLVKFDVTSSDGSANGFNYEDGTLAPEEIAERLLAINAIEGWTACDDETCGELGTTPGPRTTVQRWFADPVLNNSGNDRTLRTVFTHDHFAPSTIQHPGLYAGLVVEPAGSVWRDPETGGLLGQGRPDGGPTSWRADVLTVDPKDSYREFLLEFGDFSLAQTGSQCSVSDTGEAVCTPDRPVNPPGKIEIGLPFLQDPPPVPMPEAISADDPGTMTVNYRNEPLALRVRDPATNTQAPGVAGDLAHALRSNVTRADARLNALGGPYAQLTAGVQPGDPFTPLLRVYEGDRVQIRTLVGATEESHNLSINGVKWLFEPSEPNSGYRNSQGMGISEHFEYIAPARPSGEGGPFEDYLYMTSSSTDALWNGTWGLMRVYHDPRGDLLTLPSNPDGAVPRFANPRDFHGVCPVAPGAKGKPTVLNRRVYSVAAVLARDVLPGGTLEYNNAAELHDPTAIMLVDTGSLDKRTGKLKKGAPIEPLVLRANAGDCIDVSIENRLPQVLPDLDGWSTLPMIVERFNNNQIVPSSSVGLHPQLVTYEVANSDGMNVGFNPVQTAPPGGKAEYRWYAGNVVVCENGGPIAACTGKVDGTRVAVPVEFGASNLSPADVIKQASKGAIGALVIEPAGATWVEDSGTRASATVSTAGGSFRDFVLVFQNDVNLREGGGDGVAVPNLADAEDSEDSGQKAFNYRTEPLWARMGFPADEPLEITRMFDFGDVLTGPSETPTFTANKGQAIRFRVLMPGGHARNHVFQIHGHGWQEEPYINGSRTLGYNWMSNYIGSQQGHGPTNHFDCLTKAGGEMSVPGDYLYRDQASFGFNGGLWGILRVQ